MSEIIDSGERRQFDSGAVRDIAEGKGRMDLMPLHTIVQFYKYLSDNPPEMIEAFNLPLLLEYTDKFLSTNDLNNIWWILKCFIVSRYSNLETALLDLSIHYEMGAKKYCERNWEKGISVHSFVDSALRHGIKFIRGDNDEPHDRALMWNLFGLVWTLENKPEFNDLPNNALNVLTVGVKRNLS